MPAEVLEPLAAQAVAIAADVAALPDRLDCAIDA